MSDIAHADAGANATAARPSRRLIIVSATAWLIAVIVMPLLALLLNAVSIGGFPFGFWWTAQGALAALAVLAFVFALRARGKPTGEGLKPPLALAGEAIGAAGVIGFTGVIAALGFDGLAYPLGFAAGLALMTILIAPRFVLYPARSIPEFFEVRYGGTWPRLLAGLVVTIAAVLLLAADIRAGALLLQGLIGSPYANAAALMTVAIAGVWLGRHFMPTRRPSGDVFLALFLTASVLLVVLSLRHGSLPLPYWTYGNAISDLAALDQKLISEKLQDFKALRPMASPFFHLSGLNFTGIVLALAFGAAVLPHILSRHISQSTVHPGDAPWRSAYGTVFVAVFLMGLAAAAVYARLGVADLVSKGLETAAAPQALADASTRGWLNVCGPANADAADIAAACIKVSGQRGFLRMQDLSFATDTFVLAAPWVAGVPLWALWPFWIASLFAVLAAGFAMIAALVPGAARSEAGLPRAVSAFAAAVLLVPASLIAIFGIPDIATLVGDALALLAAAVFPAFVLGLYWRGMTAAGAVASVVTGLAIAGLYMAGVRLAPMALFEWSGALSDADGGALQRLELLQGAVEAAATDASRALAQASVDRHVGAIANWFGLKPPAIVLIALPFAFFAAWVASKMSGRRQSVADAHREQR